METVNWGTDMVCVYSFDHCRTGDGHTVHLVYYVRTMSYKLIGGFSAAWICRADETGVPGENSGLTGGAGSLQGSDWSVK